MTCAAPSETTTLTPFSRMIAVIRFRSESTGMYCSVSKTFALHVFFLGFSR